MKEHTLDTNVTCYIANGVWHHYLCTRDAGFLESMFPVVERAIDFALDHQHPTGEIEWDADPARIDGKGALLTGSSSIYSSLRCAIVAAERLGRERPDWELSLGSLAIAIAHRPERFLEKERWAMDWYYPILSGVLRGHAAHARIASKWHTFVAPTRGVRCVSDQPWITAAETCELVMALDAIGLDDRARTLFEWVQFLRHDDGSYWTGMNFEDERFEQPGVYFTAEQPTWNSAAVVLAANALGGHGPTAGLFRGAGLPAGLTAGELIEAGTAIEAETSRTRATLTEHARNVACARRKFPPMRTWRRARAIDQAPAWPPPDAPPGRAGIRPGRRLRCGPRPGPPRRRDPTSPPRRHPCPRGHPRHPRHPRHLRHPHHPRLCPTSRPLLPPPTCPSSSSGSSAQWRRCATG